VRPAWLVALLAALVIAGDAWAQAASEPAPAAASAPASAEVSAPAARALPAPAEVFAQLKRAGIPASDTFLYAQPVDADAAPVFALNADKPATLASTTKLITALAAIDLLGADYRWRTRAHLAGALKGGVLDGDLRIVGGGDPRLSSTELVDWFKRMRKRGLSDIRGNIVLDRFAFQLKPADHANTPTPTADNPHHAWPDALMLDEATITVRLSTGRDGAVQTALTPAVGGLEFVDELQRKRVRCQALRDPARIDLDERGLRPRATLVGEWSPLCSPLRLEATPAKPQALTASVVQAAWQEAGGTLAGTVVDAERPLPSPRRGAGPKPWLVHESKSLPDYLREMNKSSNNLVARHLLLALSDKFPLRAATLESARKRLSDWLAAQGLARDDIEVDNGSGLATSERGRPRALVRLLQSMWNRGPSAKPFVDSLPIAGKDGTLSGRLGDLEAGAEARLKTGSLLQVRALAGYVKAKSGRVYAVTAIVNHPNAARGEGALDAFVRWLAKHG
jgi:serine-type D-Ala-D-Ala carboxypeptidase/endopeptidase (penicillin-binding protein 4)